MNKKIRLTQYEELIFSIIFNAQEKLVASIVLYSQGISYSTAYFLAIIAEEEMAKLILIPIAKELDELNDLLDNKSSSYFNHKIKQRIFSTYGLQNRSFDEIEELKQKCLYIGKGQKSTFIKPEIVYEELKHSLRLYTKFALEISITGSYFSDDFKEAVVTLSRLVLRDCVRKEIPQVLEELFPKEEKDRLPDGLEELKMEDYFTNPYLLIGILKSALGDKYKQFLEETKRLSYNEMVQHLRKYLNIKENLKKTNPKNCL